MSETDFERSELADLERDLPVQSSPDEFRAGRLRLRDCGSDGWLLFVLDTGYQDAEAELLPPALAAKLVEWITRGRLCGDADAARRSGFLPQENEGRT